ncbi:putative protein OS=Rhizobacter sp. Root404 OX=1736528 GN=ASC76_08750 PE=4 SV=1 [Rhizobacter fulvus]
MYCLRHAPCPVRCNGLFQWATSPGLAFVPSAAVDPLVPFFHEFLLPLMFKPVTFDPYGRRRSRWRMPRWLLLLLVGIALGAGGLYFVQERYLPPRLSAGASIELRSAYETAEAARAKLAGELARTSQQLAQVTAEKKQLGDDLAGSRASVEALRGDLGAIVASLPPDPRGGAVEIRAARFDAEGRELTYDLLLTRARAGAGKPLGAALQLTVAGESAAGAAKSFTAPAETVLIGAQQVLRGKVALPEGLKPRQVTVQVLDRAGGRPLGMRVLLVGK